MNSYFTRIAYQDGETVIQETRHPNGQTEYKVICQKLNLIRIAYNWQDALNIREALHFTLHPEFNPYL